MLSIPDKGKVAEEVIPLLPVTSLQAAQPGNYFSNGSTSFSHPQLSDSHIKAQSQDTAQPSSPPEDYPSPDTVIGSAMPGNIPVPQTYPTFLAPRPIQPTFLSIPPPSFMTSSIEFSSAPSQSFSHPARSSPPVSQVTFLSEHPVNLYPASVELQLPSEDDFLYQR